jgi:hemerythrin-like domain-containing protein
MARKTERIRDHHKDILKNIGLIVTHAQTLGGSSEASLKTEFERDVAFLREDLLPHAEGEERGLYPVADDLIRKHGRPTATMSRDHVYLKREIERFCDIASKVESTGGSVLEATREALWRTAVRLEFLLSVHLEKEEQDLLPLLDDHLSQEEVDRIIDRMHGH